MYERLLKLTRLRVSPTRERFLQLKEAKELITNCSFKWSLSTIIGAMLHKELCLLFFTCKHDCLISYYRYQEEIVRLRGLLGNTARGTHARR